MSEAVSHSNANVPQSHSGVNAEFLGKFTRVATKRRLAEEALKEERAKGEEATRELKAARAELESLKGNATTKRVAELETQIRQRDYRDAFASAAREAGVKGSHLERIYKLADLDTSKPEIDPAAIAAVVARVKGEVPELFGEATTSTAAPAPTETTLTKPAPGSGKGAPVSHSGPIIDEHAAANDPAYIMNNYGRIQAALKAKHNIT